MNACTCSLWSADRCDSCVARIAKSDRALAAAAKAEAEGKKELACLLFRVSEKALPILSGGKS
jgi:hypothetical protein